MHNNNLIIDIIIMSRIGIGTGTGKLTGKSLAKD
jgi:hypothetical protein